MSRPTSRRRRGSAAAVVVAVASATVLVGLLAGCSDDGSHRARGPSTTPAASPSTTTQQNAPPIPATTREDCPRRAAGRPRRGGARTPPGRLRGDPGRPVFGVRACASWRSTTPWPSSPWAPSPTAHPSRRPSSAPTGSPQLGPDAWVSRVTGRYSLAGYDTATREFESYFTVVRRGAELAAGRRHRRGHPGAGLGPARRSPSCAARRPWSWARGPASRLRPYLALGNLAVKRVDAVWTAPVEQPPGPRGAAHGGADGRAGRPGQGLRGPGRRRHGRSVRRTGPCRRRPGRRQPRPPSPPCESRGQQVVVSHEATHVAIRRDDRPSRCRCGCPRGWPTTSATATSGRPGAGSPRRC